MPDQVPPHLGQASMRPPPAGGGYRSVARSTLRKSEGFNEAPARGRGIPGAPPGFVHLPVMLQ